MTERISKNDLRFLRNEIPVEGVIKTMLSLPTKRTDGVFRFLCPLCSEFHTAVNSKTNLARCFRCRENFNTIDLVMRVKNVNFKEAVSMLSSHLARLSQRSHPAPVPQAHSQTPHASIPEAHRHPSRGLTPIREILECALGYRIKPQIS